MTVILPGGIGQLFASIAGSAFDPAHTSTSATLSNHNKTVTGNNTSFTGVTRGIKGLNSGQKYFEIIIVTVNDYSYMGAMDASFTIADNNVLGLDSPAHSVGIQTKNGSWQELYNGTTTQTSPIVGGGPGDVVMIALDLVIGFGFGGVNGVWFNRAGVTGSPDFTFPGGTTWYPGAAVGGPSGTPPSSTLNAGGPFTYPLPSGYTAWG